MSNPFLAKLRDDIHRAQMSITSNTCDVKDLWILLERISHVLDGLEHDQNELIRMATAMHAGNVTITKDFIPPSTSNGITLIQYRASDG